MLSASYSISGCLHEHDLGTAADQDQDVNNVDWQLHLLAWCLVVCWCHESDVTSERWKMPACYIDACKAAADSIG